MSRRRGRATRREAAPDWEGVWLNQMRLHKLPLPYREFQGIEGRRYRFDFAWPTLQVAAECEGGIWMRRARGHSHASPVGISRDCEKYNLATIQGWRVIRATSTQIRDGKAIRWLAAALGYELERA